MTPEEMVDALFANKPVKVRVPETGKGFTIDPKKGFAGIMFFGIIPEGKKRALKTHGYMLMGRNELWSWVNGLDSVEN
jgi:hypothetical protein